MDEYYNILNEVKTFYINFNIPDLFLIFIFLIIINFSIRIEY